MLSAFLRLDLFDQIGIRNLLPVTNLLHYWALFTSDYTDNESLIAHDAVRLSSLCIVIAHLQAEQLS